MTEATFIEAPPTGEYLRSLANDNLKIREALGEFIDNAIDARAKSVVIEIGPQRRGIIQWMRVEDDGDGCADLIDMVQLGKHTEHKTTVLGRFGIGAKNAMLWLGGVDSNIQITSTSSGRWRRLAMAWKDYAKQWRIGMDWLDERAALEDDRGTRIHVRPCIRRFPEGKELAKLVADLGYLYSPAIKKGVQVQIRVHRRGVEPIVLQRWELPLLEKIVDTKVDVGGRGARIYVGMIKKGEPNPRPGITYVHGFRVIKSSCALGCGGMSHSNIAGFVELDEKWELTKNKDDISQHSEELGEAVFAEIKELLEEAAARGQEALFSEFNSEVERELNAMLGTASAKGVRHPGTEKGTKPPKGTKRRQKRAKEEQDGETFRRRFGRLQISYADLDDPERLGHHSGNEVILNTASAFVTEARDEPNAKAVALLALLAFLDSVRAEETSGQRRMKYVATGDIVRDVGKILSKPAVVDSQPLLRSVPDKGAA